MSFPPAVHLVEKQAWDFPFAVPILAETIGVGK
jgi:hypothetical protein